MLIAVLGSPVRETHGRTGVSPPKGHEDDEGTRASLLRKAERAGLLSVGKRRLRSVHKYLMGVCKEEGARLSSVVSGDTEYAMKI